MTDHRIKLTLHRLDTILNGDLDEIIDSLIAADQTAKLAKMNQINKICKIKGSEETTMGKYFGTDGFRGEANVDLTVEHAYKVGRFLGWYYGREHKAQIVIGKDTRRSSYMFEYSLVAGLTASGADAYLLHVTTTPSVSYVVRTENLTVEL